MNETKKVSQDDLRHDDTGLMYFDNELFTGVSLWFWGNGQLGSEINYVDGIQNGWSRGWYENGQIQGETYYKNECVDGVNREWYENGQIKLDSEIREGKSIWKKEWDRQGNLINELKEVIE
jgi:antitoxin component YwqK of YwqJK toxin-antitoxin module